MRRSRRAFTLVELMMVITIIAILSGVLLSVAVGAIRVSRAKRSAAMKTLFSTAIATYYAQEGRWPDEVESKAGSARSGVLSDDASQSVLREIVKRSSGKKSTIQPLLDPTGLFVSRLNVKEGVGYGLSFSDARAGDGARRQKIGVDQMVFGYQGRKSGKFRRFRLIYHAESDTVEVSKCCENCIQCKKGEISCSAPSTIRGEPNPKACPHCHKIEGE